MAGTRKRAVAPIVIGVLGTAVLMMLGAWQVQRLEWKEGLIAELAVRMSADPVAFPATVDPERDNLLRVKVRGTIGKAELHPLHSVKRFGAGYRIIAPMTLNDADGGLGKVILVDLGYVPEDLKDAVPREGSVRWDHRTGDDEVVGLLHWPEESDSYTPEPDLPRNIWFARDVPAMARALGTEPILLVAESHPDDTIVLPQPPGISLPNRHLEYALTWFGLAIVWSVMSIFWLRSELRKRKE